jgi:predicted MPP superfamily phosphohydrolase
MKKAGKILGIVFGSLALVFLSFVVVNAINEKRLNRYIDTFSPVVIEQQLKPTRDADGIAYFTTDREFKVMQLTDVHLGGGFLSHKTDKLTVNAIAAMIAQERPDLVVITGDISFAVPYISGTINNAYAHRLFARLMERLGVYWTVTFGNHDSEAYNYYGRKSVSKMYEKDTLTHCLFTADGELSGEGNHVIRVKNSLGLITQSFYMIDTHAYTDKDKLGLKWDYDYVKQDQIDWYEASVKQAEAQNRTIYDALPAEGREQYEHLLTPKSLMFMHIPLREVKAAYDEYLANGNTVNVEFIRGNAGESDPYIFCSRTDENLFETVVRLGSTTALFYGHDHLNNFVLRYKGVTLSYGYSLDYLAYDGIDNKGYQRGCTVITCAPSGESVIVHENYYQEKYKPQYEKEAVDMNP